MQILQRAPKLSAFVQHGSHQASIEITLKGPDDEIFVIRRTIQTENEQSKWHLNGKRYEY
jgi:hypothetical protein